MKFTPLQLELLQAAWSKTADEKIRVEVAGQMLYGFGSELGALRLFAHYNTNGKASNPKVQFGKVPNRLEWYVSILT